MKSLIRVIVTTAGWLPLTATVLLRGWVPVGSRFALAFATATTFIGEAFVAYTAIECCVVTAMIWTGIGLYVVMGLMIQVPNIYSGPMLVWNRPAC